MKCGSGKKFILIITLVSSIIFGSLAYSHCQIPCGIYNDKMRFDMIAEHITTIEKSMNQINELTSKDKPNMNQIIRWVKNKENHADELSEIVTYYFMAQRVKLPDESDTKAQNIYVGKLTLLHKMLIYSMKAKQTTDLANVEQLRSTLNDFHKIYHGESG